MNDINKNLFNLYTNNNKIENDFIEKCYEKWPTTDNSDYVRQHFYCTDEYINNKIKIMIIGQESYGWYYPNNIKESMELTKNFLYDNYYTIFWEFSYELEKSINGEKPFNKYSYFYSNIFRICVDSVYAKHLIYNSELSDEYISKIQTLSSEIKIVDPDVIVFLSGPNYDKYISNIYKGLEFCRLDDNYDVRELSRLMHTELPNNTFRLYHPMYANRYRDKYWDKIINIISNFVALN